MTKKKKLLIILVSIGVAVLIYFLYLDPKKTSVTLTPEPTTGPLSTGFPSTYEYPTGSAYFINQVVTNLTPVTGYSWKGNSLVYSTPTGIYEAGTNSSVVETKIDYIRWAYGFRAVLKSGNQWSTLDFDNRKVVPLTQSLVRPIINNEGSKILDYQGNSITIFDTTSGDKLSKGFDGQIDNVFFSENQRFIVVSTVFSNTTKVYKIDYTLSEIGFKSFDKKYHLSSISPEAQSYALTFESGIVVSDFDSDFLTKTYSQNSLVFADFRNGSELIVVEEYKDRLGRTLENVYLLDTGGTQTKISSSMPVPNRFDNKFMMIFPIQRNLATFVENNGKIWILSLYPNNIATYSTEGELVFTKIEPKGHPTDPLEDSL